MQTETTIGGKRRLLRIQLTIVYYVVHISHGWMVLNVLLFIWIWKEHVLIKFKKIHKKKGFKLPKKKDFLHQGAEINVNLTFRRFGHLLQLEYSKKSEMGTLLSLLR